MYNSPFTGNQQIIKRTLEHHFQEVRGAILQFHLANGHLQNTNGQKFKQK